MYEGNREGEGGGAAGKTELFIEAESLTSIFKNPKRKIETEIQLNIQSVPRSKHSPSRL